MRLRKGIIVTPFFGIAWQLDAWGRRAWRITRDDGALEIALGHLYYYVRRASLEEIGRGTFMDIFTRD